MNSALIVETYGAELKGQQLLFPDPDIVLRNTPFKAIDPEFDKAALIHWWMHVYVPDGYGELRTEYNIYKTWSNALWKYFKYASSNSGYNPHTNQQAVQFAGYQKESVEDQTEELRLWIPHIKPFKPEEKWDGPRREGKHVKIFEHTLSEGGSWHLWIYSDKDYALGLQRYSRYTERATFESLGKAVWFITQHNWYQKRHGTYEYD